MNAWSLLLGLLVDHGIIGAMKAYKLDRGVMLSGGLLAKSKCTAFGKCVVERMHITVYMHFAK